MRQDGVDIIDVEQDQVHMVVRDRFLAMYRHLAKNPDQYDYNSINRGFEVFPDYLKSSAVLVNRSIKFLLVNIFIYLSKVSIGILSSFESIFA